jgi:hypothetical protein
MGLQTSSLTIIAIINVLYRKGQAEGILYELLVLFEVKGFRARVFYANVTDFQSPLRSVGIVTAKFKAFVPASSVL